MATHTPFTKFKKTGNTSDEQVGNVSLKRTVIIPKNIATDSAFVKNYPKESVFKCAAEPRYMCSPPPPIIRNCLHRFPYKIQQY